MHQAWELDIHNHNHNRNHINRNHISHNHINHNNINQIVPMYTFMDLMKELVSRPDRVFILIVKSLHLIIKMHNHVGHELAIR
jgi:hypothetical protein